MWLSHFVIKEAKSHILLNGNLNELYTDTGTLMFTEIDSEV